MALKRSAIQPVGTSPAYAKTSGKNAYSAYGTTTKETSGQGGQTAAQYGILGAMAASPALKWADEKGYFDGIRDKIGMSNTPNAYDTSFFDAQNAQKNGYTSANPMADFHAGDPMQGLQGPDKFGISGVDAMNGMNTGMQAGQAGMQAAQAGAQSSEDLAQLVASLYA